MGILNGLRDLFQPNNTMILRGSLFFPLKAATGGLTVAWDAGRKRKGTLMKRRLFV